MRLRFLLTLGLLLSFTACRPAVEEQTRPETVVFLVRHAEKVDDSRDPELSDAGRARAAELAALLESSGIERVYSTDYIRTRETARPLAERLGLEVGLYDELEALANQLGSQPRRALVVGHSNTIPSLVELLGGDPGAPIGDDEYDRLYIVSLSRAGGAATTTVLLRLPAAAP